MPPNPFDVDALLAIPRLLDIHLSADGARLALTVQTVASEGTSYTGSVWEVATRRADAPRRLTRSARGETARGFLPDGSLVFTSSRADPEATDDRDEPPGEALYLLPASGGEPRRLAAPAGGVGQVLTAARSATVVFTAPMHPGATTFDEDRAVEQARHDAGVQARLVEHYPARFWDHPLGPRAPRLFALDLSDPDGDISPPLDLTPAPPWPGWLEEVSLALSDDGTTVAFCPRMRAGRDFLANLAVVSTRHGQAEKGGAGSDSTMRLLAEGDIEHGAVAWSPDGSRLAVAWQDPGTPDNAPHAHLAVVDAHSGEQSPLLSDMSLQPTELLWTCDGRAVLMTADANGQCAIFEVGLDGTTVRLTAAGCYASMRAAPDGRTLFAIRSSIAEPPQPVSIDLTMADQVPTPLPSPVTVPDIGVTVTSVTTTAADGTAIQSFLVLPDQHEGTPLPLAVFIHGGPIASWGPWQWRWCSALLAARGWAVLLPNPRLSTGFGREHIAAAWNDWATLPSSDILAAVEAIADRPDIDGGRIAALGGSYGGYMANWFAVHCDRFAAIVTHASIWDLTMERGASDAGLFLEHEFGHPVRNEENWRRQSPHLAADALHTPMLVIHGEHDDRVPIGNALHLWTDLQMRDVPSRMLIFPDENHWILKPQNTRLWYQTVFAFLDEHVLGRDFVRPEHV